ncbi:hypothetical protein PHLCEN_2v8843 [Hermanssonia centrifuga]|uniref:FAM192A/Fyv6 N-terminal domain-containing protein n=1 Tax=Hermanssonia centrifuga TaxID=98765 RepID=A0A2R6NST1_9APHY|nr:hypothetical protein PHLCEN_2v8843 [Hermanssonia centrifuga]
MEESIPSISSGAVGSRFITQSELETAKARRDEQWKAAYARCIAGPTRTRSRSNQFRALEEDEVLFLDSVLEKQREEERIRKEMDGEELKNFRQAVAARENAAKPPPIVSEVLPAAPSKTKPTTVTSTIAKKDTKKALKGVLVKKKSKPSAAASPTKTKLNVGESEIKPTADADVLPPAKRRRVTEPES